LIAEIVQPLHAEVTSLRERLARPESNRSQFEVSLSYIPPELEEKLWVRLRQDLGEQVVQHASQQAAQVLGSANASIEQKLAEAETEFRQHLTQELRTVETRAHRLSDEIGDGIRQQFHAGSEKFQQHTLQAGAQLSLRSEEFLQALQQRLGEEHAAHLREVGQVQEAITAESSRQQKLIGELGNRVGRLDEFTHRLESDLDTRLAELSSDVISRTRTQLDSDAGAIMKQMEIRSSAELGNQLDSAGGHLKMMQQEIEGSVSNSLRVHAEETVRSFEQAMDELAGHAVGRWRRALARDLGSVARILGDEVRLEIVSDGTHK
jgi:DNA anti-recombination protein RmuC